MKNKKITIGQAVELRHIINQLAEAGEDGKPKHALPFKFKYALQRTAKKIAEALEPLQEKFDAIWKEWNTSKKDEWAKKIEAAKGKKKDELKAEFEKEFKGLAGKWAELQKEEIEVEVYEFPAFRDCEFEMLDRADINLVDLDVLVDVMNLSIQSDAA